MLWNETNVSHRGGMFSGGNSSMPRTGAFTSPNASQLRSPGISTAALSCGGFVKGTAKTATGAPVCDV